MDCHLNDKTLGSDAKEHGLNSYDMHSCDQIKMQCTTTAAKHIESILIDGILAFNFQVLINTSPSGSFSALRLLLPSI